MDLGRPLHDLCFTTAVLIFYCYKPGQDVMEEQKSALSEQVADLKKKIAMIQEKLRHEPQQLQNIQAHGQMLESQKELSTKLHKEIESLQQRIQQLTNTQQQVRLQPLPKNTSLEEFAKRRRRVQYVCSSSKVPGSVDRVLTHSSGVIYCIVPKAGCTFWKRIFTAVKRQGNITMETITSISRESVHNDDGRGVSYNSTFSAARYPTRFIVTRDPYSRLMSSYLDKVYLPDFWQAEIVPMIQKRPTPSPSNVDKDFLRAHFDKMADIFKEDINRTDIPTAKESRCGKYVTFSEFVVDGFEREEPHWMPIHQICNPCVFNVTHVGSMDTFTQDARVILSHMKLDGVMDDYDENTQIDEEITIISNYNFHHFFKEVRANFYKTCITSREIAYRLWHNYKWRGYIDPDVEYKIPEFKDEKNVEDDFMSQIWSARKSGLQNPKRMKAAKKEFKKKAFASISKDLFEKLSQKYALDFKLFGYTDARNEMYSTYYNGYPN